MTIQRPQLRTAPQLMFRIAIVLTVLAVLSALFDPAYSDPAGRIGPRAPSGLLAAWAKAAPAPLQEANPGARVRARCAECGVIVSSLHTEAVTEVMDAGAPGEPAAVSSRRWITVRLADGSSRVINDARPADWRMRERVVVVGGLASE